MKKALITGIPKREFLHVDDLAEVCFFLLQTYHNNLPINIGTGEDISFRELAVLLKEIKGYTGQILWNTERPDGTPRKLLDIYLIHSLGWRHRIALEDGIRIVYKNKFLN